MTRNYENDTMSRIVKRFDAVLVETLGSYSQEETAVEIEREYYAKLSDFDQLDRAHRTEDHEQWEYRLMDGTTPIGTMRSRMIDFGESYEFTIKQFRDKAAGKTETNLGATADVHEVIKALADRCLKKTRYVFPVVVKHNDEDLELKWEVDVFRRPDGELEPWIKIDFELPTLDIVVPAFPLNVDEIFEKPTSGHWSDELKTKVDEIYKRVLHTK